MQTNETNHTPGPWKKGKRQPENHAVNVLDERGFLVAQARAAGGGWSEAAANAALIAAAPETAAERDRLKRDLSELLDDKNMPRRYIQRGGVGYIYCLHGTSSISAYEELEKENAELLEALENILKSAVILGREYLSAFDHCRPDHCIQGWEKSRWITAADDADKAHAAIAKAKGIRP